MRQINALAEKQEEAANALASKRREERAARLARATGNKNNNNNDKNNDHCFMILATHDLTIIVICTDDNMTTGKDHKVSIRSSIIASPLAPTNEEVEAKAEMEKEKMKMFFANKKKKPIKGSKIQI